MSRGSVHYPECYRTCSPALGVSRPPRTGIDGRKRRRQGRVQVGRVRVGRAVLFKLTTSDRFERCEDSLRASWRAPARALDASPRAGFRAVVSFWGSPFV